MSHRPSTSTIAPSETSTKNPEDLGTSMSLTSGFINTVAGHIRQRVTSFARPAAPPTVRMLVDEPAPFTSRTPNPRPKTLSPSTKSLLSTRISEAITTTISTSSVYQGREPWDIANSPENQALQTAFVKYCTVPMLSPPELSPDSPCAHAHIALACFTPLQKLRAVLVGSNKRAFRIGEVYASAVEPIVELSPTSVDALPPNEGFDGVIVSFVAEQLQKDFNMTAQLMENFIFPVKLIEPFNMATRLINRSQFLQYLLARWRLIMHEHKYEATKTNQIGGRRSKAPQRARNAEIVFLEWYLASSPPMISAMLTVLKGGDCPARERLLIDLHGNALARRNESLERVLSRELEILATVRRDISVAIDNLFWQRVEMVRTPPGIERPQGNNAVKGGSLVEGKDDRMKRGSKRSGRTRDDRSLRIEVGIRSHTWALLSARAVDVVGDE